MFHWACQKEKKEREGEFATLFLFHDVTEVQNRLLVMTDINGTVQCNENLSIFMNDHEKYRNVTFHKK